MRRPFLSKSCMPSEVSSCLRLSLIHILLVAEGIMHGGVRNMKGEKQMIYRNITFKAAPFSYDLTFDDRITPVSYTHLKQILNILNFLRRIICWDVYWSCNKRFFAYYTLQYKGSYSDDAKSCLLYTSLPHRIL